MVVRSINVRFVARILFPSRTLIDTWTSTKVREKVIGKTGIKTLEIAAYILFQSSVKDKTIV